MITKKITNISSNSKNQSITYKGIHKDLDSEALKKTSKETVDSIKKSSKILDFLKAAGNKIKKACVIVFKAVFDLD